MSEVPLYKAEGLGACILAWRSWGERDVSRMAACRGSNRPFQVLHFHWRPPESGSLCCKLGQLTTTICPRSDHARVQGGVQV